jgi:ATP-dependent helicase/nuclease subunit A
VGADHVWILDYKTNRPPPERAEEVPGVYLRQMRAYRDAVSKVYPGRAVTCALLWTDGPRLMVLPELILNRG